MGSIADNKETVRRAVGAWNARDRDAFDACYADQLVLRTGDGPDDFRLLSQDEHWGVSTTWFDRLDATATERDMLAEGDRVLVRWTYSYRHIGTVRGIEPTGKEFSIDGWQLFRVEDGLIVEERTILDMLRLYVELGVVEVPESAQAGS